jgi:fucose 4-O-acetylase-like acetyltransferase
VQWTFAAGHLDQMYRTMTDIIAPEATGATRIVWIDATKGLAIALVVFGHVLGGILARNWLSWSGPWRGVYDFIYLFHMPAFFMISGLLLYDRARSEPVAALISRIGSVAWPYFLWDVVIRWSLLPFIGPFMSSQPPRTTLPELLMLALAGELSWFFWTLFLVQAIYILLAGVPAPILLSISVLVSILLTEANLGTLRNLIDFMPFLLLGATARPYLDRLRIDGTILQLAGTLLVFSLMAVAVWQGWTTLQPVKFACSVAGIFAAIALVQCFPRCMQSGLLASLGTASLVIYLLHPYFQGATRALISASLGPLPYAQLVLQTLTAIAGAFMVWSFAERVGATWLFRLPMPSITRKVRPS